MGGSTAKPPVRELVRMSGLTNAFLLVAVFGLIALVLRHVERH
ncbi:hypothetical protein [Umezawaea sp. Da 62-37]|nr:hypothetical protein [Umezawaea sp. Da 62-37]WNV85154.1 hypothetical protein RM788_44645 [Umezawaea sp. Da 62-37]